MKAFNVFLVILVAILISCYAPQEDIDLAKPIKDWVISDDFDFKTYEEVEINIDLFPFGGDYFEIYSDENYSELVTSFRTNSFGSRVLKNIHIPIHRPRLYIKSSIGEFSVAVASKINIDHSTLDNLQKNNSNSNSRVASSGRGNFGEHFGYYCAHAQISDDFDLIFLRTRDLGSNTYITVSFYYDEDLSQPAVDYDGNYSVVIRKSQGLEGLWLGQHLKVPTKKPIKYFYVHEYDEIVAYDFSCDDISNIDGSNTVVTCLGKKQDKVIYYAFTPDNNDDYHDYGDGNYPWWFSYLTVEWLDVNSDQTFYTTEFAGFNNLYLEVQPDVAIAKHIIFNRGEDVFSLNLDDCPDEYSNNFLFSLYYPYKGGVATLVFEDLWPEKGDYDFNDLVVEYNVEYKHSFDLLKEVVINYTLKHVGASLESGLVTYAPFYYGIEIEGTIRKDDFIVDEPSGCEAGHSSYDNHIVIFDNASKLITPYSNGEFFSGSVLIRNTKQRYVEDDLEFYSFSNTQIDSLRHLGRRSKEIHMADKKGSKLAYSGFYGLADDTSDPLKTRYYRTINNLPWAFEIPTTFNLPDERQPITEKYPRFASWAQSGGELDKDWYMD